MTSIFLLDLGLWKNRWIPNSGSAVNSRTLRYASSEVGGVQKDHMNKYPQGESTRIEVQQFNEKKGANVRKAWDLRHDLCFHGLDLVDSLRGRGGEE